MTRSKTRTIRVVIAIAFLLSLVRLLSDFVFVHVGHFWSVWRIVYITIDALAVIALLLALVNLKETA